MNKKALSQPIMILTSFVIISIMFIFTSVLIFEAGEDYVISETADIGRNILSNQSTAEVQGLTTTIDELQADYSAFAFPYDLFFLLMWISTFSFTVYSTFLANKEGIFSFFGFLFIGSMLMLLITTYLSTFTSWFMTNIFDALFNDLTLSLPIFTFYLSNLGLINFIWWIILLLVSIIDRNFISRTGEVQE